MQCQKGGRLKLPESGRSILIEYQYELVTQFVFSLCVDDLLVMLVFEYIFCDVCFAIQVIVEKAERSDIPDIDKKKLVASPFQLLIKSMVFYLKSFTGDIVVVTSLS